MSAASSFINEDKSNNLPAGKAKDAALSLTSLNLSATSLNFEKTDERFKDIAERFKEVSERVASVALPANKLLLQSSLMKELAADLLTSDPQEERRELTRDGHIAIWYPTPYNERKRPPPPPRYLVSLIP